MDEDLLRSPMIPSDIWFLLVPPVLLVVAAAYLLGRWQVQRAVAATEFSGPPHELTLLASSTTNAVLLLDAQGCVDWVNQGFVLMNGYSLDEVRGLRLEEFRQGEASDPATLDFIRDCLAKGQCFETEVVHYHKNGQAHWAHVDVQVVHDAQGKLTGYVSIERDITHAKEVEVALRLSEARLREVQEIARIGSWELDLLSDQYHLSAEAIRIHGLPPGQDKVARASLVQLIHPDDREALQRGRSEAMAGLGTYSAQIRLLFPDGRLRYIHVRGAVHADDQVHANRIVGTVQDITEQKLAELALQQLNETLEQRVHERTQEIEEQRVFITSIVETAEALMFVLDQQGHIVQFNAACERLTGYRREEVLGRPLWESVIPPERRDKVRESHSRLTVRNKLTREREVEWMTKDGRRRLVSWNNALLADEEGHLRYIVVTGIDVTERKQAERDLSVANQELSSSIDRLRQTQAQLVQAEKMASLGGLVAGISHEINTPIGIALTSATALQEEMVQLRRDFESGSMKRSSLERYLARGQEGHEILVRNLVRAAELIRSFKQVAVDQSSDAPREIDLAHYVDEIVLSLQPRFRGRRIRVVNESGEGIRLLTHPGAISQVLSNLLLNALQHAYEPEQEGTVSVRIERVGDQIQIDCADDGCGVPAAIRDRIFDPFFTTRRGSGGSGLGLHIVYNLVVTTLGGVIELVPHVGPGTTFRIRFPILQEQRHEQQ